MKKYILILCIILIIIIVTTCAPLRKESPLKPKPESKVNDNITKIVANQTAKEPSTEAKEEISDEFKELLNKSKTKVKSIYYKYRGPETEKFGDNFYGFYVKDTKIKYLPYREVKALDKPESYNSIYIDKIAKTAQTYCDEVFCIYKGKKGDLNYNDAYISTIFDWINGITKATKVGEEVIDDRNVWKIETNKGTMWIDTFYGLPLKIDSSGKTYRFQQIAVNSIKDADVAPS